MIARMGCSFSVERRAAYHNFAQVSGRGPIVCRPRPGPSTHRTARSAPVFQTSTVEVAITTYDGQVRGHDVAASHDCVHGCSRGARPAPLVLVCGLIAIHGSLTLGFRQQSADAAARAFLTQSGGLGEADVRRINNGGIVSRTLPADHEGEVAVVGVAPMRVTPQFYASRLADIATFKKLDAVLQIGTFSDRPQLSNVRGLTLDPSEVRALRDCRVHDCDLQLPAAMIERFRAEIDWHAPDSSARATALVRQGLVEYVGRYRASGGREHLVYADERKPVDVGAEFEALVNTDRVLPRFPELRRWLLDPSAALSRMADVVYWSKERAAGRTVISITHLSIVHMPGGSPAEYVASSKQLYASRYFDVSLGLTVLIPDRSADAARTVVVYLNRSRLDAFGGLFGGLARRIVRSRASGGLDDQLERVRTRLEADFAGAEREGAVCRRITGPLWPLAGRIPAPTRR